MEVTVKLLTVFQRYLPGGSCGQATIQCSEGETVEQLLARLHVPEDIPKIILVNGAQKGLGEILHDGDRLDVFPPIAGG